MVEKFELWRTRFRDPSFVVPPNFFILLLSVIFTYPESFMCLAFVDKNLLNLAASLGEDPMFVVSGVDFC